MAVYSKRWINADTDEVNYFVNSSGESKDINQFWYKECHDYTQAALLYDLWKKFSKIGLNLTVL